MGVAVDVWTCQTPGAAAWGPSNGVWCPNAGVGSFVPNVVDGNNSSHASFRYTEGDLCVEELLIPDALLKTIPMTWRFLQSGPGGSLLKSKNLLIG
jgi:hypothetical protein